ncbi:TPA: hypothetical protein EYO63_19670, partial [Candidatus Poribacteria bacterium]|nr:hypothetical protein [Candidatus Poribacteria bacterium]HIN29780.1 hypothetical protein [Candidatus Poribacteria bacterium]HIO78696.1 hypothetical protein [Candidatus Poribacteria bacterium]
GFVVLVPDIWGHGDSSDWTHYSWGNNKSYFPQGIGDPHQYYLRGCIADGLWAVQHLYEREEVDADRVRIIGNGSLCGQRRLTHRSTRLLPSPLPLYPDTAIVIQCQGQCSNLMLKGQIMLDVFISYSRKDIEFAQRLHHALEARDREPCQSVENPT